VTRPTTPEEILAVVRRREEAATTALAAAAGDTSLCALSRSGTSHPAVKFHEGAAAALAQVRRLLTRQPGTEAGAAIVTVRDAWNDQNALLAGRSRDWAAYHAGGLEALDALAEELAPPG
jgi:hypothetical protein